MYINKKCIKFVKYNKHIKNETNPKKDINKNYKSVSLILYSNEYGYLFCEESTNTKDKTLLNPISFKINTDEESLYKIAIKEFIKELKLETHSELNNEKLVKTELVMELINIFDKNYNYIDLCFNKKYKYVHRYYIIHIDKIENKKKHILMDLQNYFNKNFANYNYKIQWYKHTFELMNKYDFSWITKYFLKKNNNQNI